MHRTEDQGTSRRSKNWLAALEPHLTRRLMNTDSRQVGHCARKLELFNSKNQKGQNKREEIVSRCGALTSSVVMYVGAILGVHAAL